MEIRISKCVLCGGKGSRKGFSFSEFPHKQPRFKKWINEISPFCNTLEVDTSFLNIPGRICAKPSKEKDFVNLKNFWLSNPHLTMDIEIDNDNTLENETPQNEPYEEDTFQCGRCKSQFQILSEFISHKKFQCELSDGVKISENNSKPNNIPLFNNSGINNHDELSGNFSQETENEMKEKISNAIEELSGESVSFILNNDGNLVEFPSLAGQVILTPNMTVDNGGPILLNNSINYSSASRLILASDSSTGTYGKDIVITCPINNLILAPDVRTRPIRNGAVANNKMVPTSEVFDCPVQNYPTDGVQLPPEAFTCPIRGNEVAPSAEMYTGSIPKDVDEETLPTSEVLTCPVRSESINDSGDALNDEVVLSSEALAELESGICLETLNYFGLKPTFKRSRADSSHKAQSSEDNRKLELQGEGELERENGKAEEGVKGENGDVGWEEQDENEEKRKRKKSSKKGSVKSQRAQLSCSYCGKPFEKAFNLAQHERTHTGERPFQCIICGRAFTQKSNVRKHMVRHKVFPHGKLTLKGQSDMNSLTVGKALLENGQSYSCPYCPSTFKTYSEHKKHLSGHSDRKVYRCIQKNCNEMFSDLDDYLSHSKQHSAAEFQCHVCLKMFYSLDELGAHQYDHDVSEKERDDSFNGPKYKVKCEVCHSRFQTVEALKHHMAIDSHHYECAECKSVFHSERFLRRHLSIHVDPTQMNFECSHCGKKFRTQKFLDNHLFVHLDEKPFTCEHCDKKFSSKYRLKRHLAIHLNQFYECPFRGSLGCTKTFYRKDKLRDHVATHSHLRLHLCPFCAKTYSSTATLNNHMRRHHKVSKNSQLMKRIKSEFGLTKRRDLLRHGFIITGEKIGGDEQETPTEGDVNQPVANIEIIMVPCIPTIRRNRK